MAFINNQGVKIYWDEQGAGEPVLLIMGLGYPSDIWYRTRPLLAARYRTIALDNRGVGRSDTPPGPYPIALMASDAAAVLDASGLESAHVYGVSMGGMIAQEFALRHPRKVQALVLGCTTPGGPKAVRLGGEALTNAYSTQPMSAEERGKALAEAAFTKGYIEQHPEIIPAMIEARRQRPLDPVALAHRMKAAYAHDTYDRLSQITCPTLVITGKDDVLISWENSRILAERVPSAKLVLLEPAGHCFWLEQPEQSREAILAFLSSVP